MASLIGTMAVLCTAIGISNHFITANRVDKAISILHQNGGTFLPPGTHFDPSDFNFQITPETPFETRYFIVELTAQQEIRSVVLDHIAALDRQTVVDTISQIVNTGAERGYAAHYRFGVFPDEAGGSTVIVLDCFLQLQASNNMLCIMVIIFLACVLIVFALLLFIAALIPALISSFGHVSAGAVTSEEIKYSYFFENYEAVYDVRPNRSMRVTETLTVHYTGTESTGFIKYLPVNGGEQVRNVKIYEHLSS